MKTIFAIAATAAFFAGTAANAATTVYNSRVVFTSAASPLTTETFQGCGNSTTSIGGSLSSSSSACGGSIASGVTFSAPSGGDLFVAASGQSTNPTTALGLNTPLGGALTATFSALTSAVGADLFQNIGGGSQGGAAPFVVSLFNGASLVDTFAFNVAPNGGKFWGVTSTSAFNRVTIAQTNGFAVLDNFSFGQMNSAVPEPATWAMMIGGFALVGASVRRRRSVSALAA